MILNQIASGGGSAPASDEWVRPTDWPAMPTLQDNRFDGLLAVMPAPHLNYVALTVVVTGGFTVDWGDGTTDTWASNAIASHAYDYGSVASPVTSRGYKTVMVTVTSTTGGSDWSSFSLQRRHPALTVATVVNWLDVSVQAPLAHTIAFGQGTNLVQPRMLERVVVGTASLTTATAMFNNCPELQSVSVADTSKVTRADAMFNFCASLRHGPELDLSGVTHSAGISGMFSYCFNLLDVPNYNTSSVLSFGSMFSQCYSLTKAPILDTSNAINVSGLFYNTYSLRSVPTYDTSKVTGCGEMFRGSSVNPIPPLNLSAVAGNPSRFVQGHVARKIGPIDFSGVATNITDGLGSNALEWIELTGLRYSFSVAGSSLSPEALNALFTSLGIANTGATVTVTNNWGISGCDTTIATNKGWTVVT